MADPLSKLDSTPLFLAVQAINLAANASDQTPNAPGRQYIQVEAALLCQRAGEELLRRLVDPV